MQHVASIPACLPEQFWCNAVGPSPRRSASILAASLERNDGRVAQRRLVESAPCRASANTAAVCIAVPSWLAHTIASRSPGSSSPHRPSPSPASASATTADRRRSSGSPSEAIVEPSAPSATAAPWYSDSSKPLRVETRSARRPHRSASCPDRDTSRPAGRSRSTVADLGGPCSAAAGRGATAGRGEMAVDHVVAAAPFAGERLHHRRRRQRQDRADGTEQRGAGQRRAERRRPDGAPSCGP